MQKFKALRHWRVEWQFKQIKSTYKKYKIQYKNENELNTYFSSKTQLAKCMRFTKKYGYVGKPFERI